MFNKNLLIRISLVLVVFNLLLAGLAMFSYRGNHQKEEVMGASSVPIFDKNFVMSDYTFSSTRAFPTQQSVQDYLDRVNSPLRNYREGGKSASYWIFNAARGNTSSKFGVVPQINPGVILAYLEKEQSLLSASNYNTSTDPAGRIRKAMGYGCPDTAACDSQYYGFANQVNWGAYQLQYNYILATNSTPTPYKVNRTITTLDEYNVFLTNAATAAQYRYTPHVYWGNYNLWKIIVANGWGVSSQTYSMAAIDNANLPLKDTPVQGDGITVSEAEGMAAVRRVYSIETQNDNVRTLQIYLRQKGYYTIREINGLYGFITRDAHYAFRRDFGIINDFTTQNEAECRALFDKSWVIGQESNEVKKLQACLRDIGLFSWPTNSGYFGPVTQEALEAARRALGSGGGGDNNQDEIDSGSNQNTCNTLKNRSWQIGQTGSDVRQLQACLRAEGHFTWPSDTGYFGPVTQEALEKSLGGSPQEYTCNELRNQTWQIGEKSERVRQLQVCMQNSGHFNWIHGATGYFGPVTQEALEKWRADSSNSSTPAPAPAPTPAPAPDATSTDKCAELIFSEFRVGNRNSEVKELQKCLQKEGFFNWKHGATGFYGNVTKTAHARRLSSNSKTIFSCRQLKRQPFLNGERGERIRQLQVCMQNSGHFNWTHGATGFYGPVTQTAVVNWRGWAE